jgi:Flp pilus assembly pilin Flp
MGAEMERPYNRTMMNRVSMFGRAIGVRWNMFQSAERGASMVEYALLIALIALVAIAGVSFFGLQLDGAYDDIGSSIVDATN